MLNDCPTCKWCSGNTFGKALISGVSEAGFICNCPDVVNQFQLAQIRGYAMTHSNLSTSIYNCKYEPKEPKINNCSHCGSIGKVKPEMSGFRVSCACDSCSKCSSLRGTTYAAICEWNERNPVKQTKSNQGLKYCFKCNTPTVKVSTGIYSVYDICPVCKI